MFPATTLDSPAPAADRGELTRSYGLVRGGGIDGLVLRSRPASAPSAGEVRVRMRAVSLNYRDLMVAHGQSGARDRVIVPGSDGAGEVLAVGAGVTEFKPGDRVISSFYPDWQSGPASDAVLERALGGSMDGVLAEDVVLPAGAWVRMPGNLGYVEAATLSCAGVTAWNALFCVEALPAGATVALLGTGGVSLWALRLARAAGHRVIVTSSDDDKLLRVRGLGADATVNYRRHPDWGEEILRLTAGVGVDRVLDIGGPDTVAQSITALRTGGSVAIIGRLTGMAPAQFDPAALFGGAKRLLGLTVGSRALTDDLARFVEQRRIRPVIDQVFPFEQAREAYARLASARHLGKVVIAIA